MDISTYEHIIEISRQGSIAKAADNLFMSRSSLSRQLIAAEEEFGAEIFKRISNRLVLTHPGCIFMEMAIKIVEEYQHAKMQIDDITGGYSGRLQIGLPPSRSRVILPYIIKKFSSIYPNICIEGSFLDSADAIASLTAGYTDMAILSARYITPELVAEPLCQDEYVLLVNKDHPLAKRAGTDKNGRRKSFDLRWFKDDLFGFDSQNSSARKICEDLFNSCRMEPRLILDNCRYDLLMELVSKGCCISIALDTFMDYYDNLVAFSFPQPIYNTLVVVRRKGYTFSKPEQTFVDIVKEYYSQHKSRN
ncbi:MAG: LysR family transcriptional regulator [Candidatus Heteroscillospira sp.]|jgi:DNA-binding transcriptional LysR family regulator